MFVSPAGNGLLVTGNPYARQASKSAAHQARCAEVQARLRPFGGRWEAMAKDLELIARLLTYPDALVAQTTLARAKVLLPVPTDADAAACAAWIRGHRQELRWDDRAGRYVR